MVTWFGLTYPPLAKKHFLIWLGSEHKNYDIIFFPNTYNDILKIIVSTMTKKDILQVTPKNILINVEWLHQILGIYTKLYNK